MEILNDYQENYGSGWISIYRSIRKHWIWKDPIKLKWWLDILIEVNHSGQKVNIGYDLFECERGQSVKSLLNWAKQWGVSKDTVRNFFTLLKKDDMIKTENLKKTTRLTVCNYDTYQSFLHDKQTTSKRNPSDKQTRPDPNNNVNNEKEIKIKVDFDIFWNSFHTITGKLKTDRDPAFKHWKKLTDSERKKAHDRIRIYFDSLNDKKFCKKARTYLADKNFNDDYADIKPTKMYKFDRS